MGDNSLFRDETAELVRIPTSGLAKVNSGPASSAGGAGPVKQNYYAPCGDPLPQQLQNNPVQPTPATILASLTASYTSASKVSINGYYDGLIQSPFWKSGHTTSPRWDGTYPTFSSTPDAQGVYYFYIGASPDPNNFFGFGGSNPISGLANDQLPAAGNTGGYDLRTRSFSVRTVNGVIYWMISMVDTVGLVAGNWYKICGMTPVGEYTLIEAPLVSPPGTVITDFPLFNNGTNHFTMAPEDNLHGNPGVHNQAKKLTVNLTI